MLSCESLFDTVQYEIIKYNSCYHTELYSNIISRILPEISILSFEKHFRALCQGVDRSDRSQF